MKIFNPGDEFDGDGLGCGREILLMVVVHMVPQLQIGHILLGTINFLNKSESEYGTCQMLLSGFFLLRGGGGPPNNAKGFWAE